MFCSKECYDKALGTYHRYECKSGILGLALKYQDYYLSKLVAWPMRLLTTKPLSYYRENEKKLGIFEETNFNLDVGKIYSGEDVSNLWKLDAARGALHTDRYGMMKFAAAAQCAFPSARLGGGGGVEKGSEEVAARALLWADRIARVNGFDLEEVHEKDRFVSRGMDMRVHLHDCKVSQIDVSFYVERANICRYLTKITSFPLKNTFFC